MSGWWRLVPAAVLSLILVAPWATADPTGCQERCTPTDPDVNDPTTRSLPPVNIILYGHWHDAVNLAPLSTIPPDPVVESDLNYGFLLPTVRTNLTCGDCNVHFASNQFSMFLSPASVELAPDTCRGSCSTGGLALDLWLGDGPLDVYAYFSPNSLATTNSDSFPLAAGAVPSVVAEARWETGHNVGRGVPLAAGVSEPATLIGLPGGDSVYEFRIPLWKFVPMVPYYEEIGGSILTVKLSQVNRDGTEVLQSDWRLRTGPDFPWRIVVPVLNPLQRLRVMSWYEGHDVGVRWFVQSPFGAYDVDDSTFRLTLRDDAGAEVSSLAPDGIRHRTEPNGQSRPINATWILREDEVAELGARYLELGVLNRQGTFRLVDVFEVPLKPLEAKSEGVPGPGLAFLVAGIGLAVLVRGRARRAETDGHI